MAANEKTRAFVDGEKPRRRGGADDGYAVRAGVCTSATSRRTPAASRISWGSTSITPTDSTVISRLRDR
jgi:hypothetical protein